MHDRRRLYKIDTITRALDQAESKYHGYRRWNYNDSMSVLPRSERTDASQIVSTSGMLTLACPREYARLLPRVTKPQNSIVGPRSICLSSRIMHGWCVRTGQFDVYTNAKRLASSRIVHKTSSIFFDTYMTLSMLPLKPRAKYHISAPSGRYLLREFRSFDSHPTL
jgi:hypothetical protein